MRPRIVAHTVSYPPFRRIGAELATHNLLRYLVGQGWEAAVVPHGATALDGWPRRRASSIDVDGVTVHHPATSALLPADIIYAHIPFTRQARKHADRVGARFVAALHGGPPGWGAARLAEVGADLTLANSETMRVSLERTGLPVHILRPPVYAQEHDIGGTERAGHCITLVNPNRDKGGELFAELACRLGGVRFLAVEGGYATQDVPDFSRLRNVEVLPHGTPMVDVWRRTRILLMPSKAESWGMVAVEAMINGIPVIGSMAPGLVECLGGAGRTLPLDDVDAWEGACRSLLAGIGEYWPARMRAYRRAAELDPTPDLRATERALAALIGQEVPQAVNRYKNVRTGQVVDIEPGTPTDCRLAGMPLVWHREGGQEAPGGSTSAGSVSPETDPADVAPDAAPKRRIPELAEPGRGSTHEAWVEYAVACGAPREAAQQATRAALIAMYGDS